MRKYLVLTICMASIFVLTGCGHNGLAYFNGRSFNIGFNPKTYEGGIQYTQGESLLVGSKENTTVQVQTGVDANMGVNTASGNADTGKISKIKYSTGIQINGYVVDLAEANPKFAAELINEMKIVGKQTKYYSIKNNKLVEISAEEYNKATSSVVKIDRN